MGERGVGVGVGERGVGVGEEDCGGALAEEVAALALDILRVITTIITFEQMNIQVKWITSPLSIFIQPQW